MERYDACFPNRCTRERDGRTTRSEMQILQQEKARSPTTVLLYRSRHTIYFVGYVYLVSFIGSNQKSCWNKHNACRGVTLFRNHKLNADVAFKNYRKDNEQAQAKSKSKPIELFECTRMTSLKHKRFWLE